MLFSSKQRSFLRAEAHGLKPVVQIGKEGITENVIASINDAFNTREVLKIKVLETAPETASESVKSILAGMDDTYLVQVMGRIITLFRQSERNPKIVLPA